MTMASEAQECLILLNLSSHPYQLTSTSASCFQEEVGRRVTEATLEDKGQILSLELSGDVGIEINDMTDLRLFPKGVIKVYSFAHGRDALLVLTPNKTPEWQVAFRSACITLGRRLPRGQQRLI